MLNTYMQLSCRSYRNMRSSNIQSVKMLLISHKAWCYSLVGDLETQVCIVDDIIWLATWSAQGIQMTTAAVKIYFVDSITVIWYTCYSTLYTLFVLLTLLREIIIKCSCTSNSMISNFKWKLVS